MFRRFVLFSFFFALLPTSLTAQGTRLLRQPTLSQDHIAFAGRGDLAHMVEVHHMGPVNPPVMIARRFQQAHQFGAVSAVHR